ncbi:MAG: succinyl-diaminopimelate desuccinylase [Planctomycetota bacterium]
MTSKSGDAPGPYAARVLDLTEELVRIPSVLGDERAIADHLERCFAAAHPHALVRARNSLCVVPRPLDATRRTLLLVGHVDTVPPSGGESVRREGDRLHGLGASDMKAGDALIVWALERARVAAPRHNIVGVLYAREEGPYLDSELPAIHEAARPWFDAAQLAICFEPTDNFLELGCLGTCHANVVFAGKRAHSARPWQGENAIHKAAGFLERLARLERREHRFHDLSFYEVVSATQAESLGARNVVPDKLRLNVNYRFAPGKDREQVIADLRALVRDEATFELVDFCPAGRVCADNALVRELQARLPDATPRAKQGWTDVGRLSHLGLDAINWGPGATAQAHQADEWVSMSAVVTATAVLSAWLFS